MFALDSFAKIDSSFQVRSAKGRAAHVATLCSLDQFHQDGMIFIKNKKYYERLLDKLNKIKSRIESYNKKENDSTTSN